MRRNGVAIAVAGIITVAFAVVSNPTFSEERSIKDLMAENFAGMQHILVKLITSNYQTLPADLDVIREHADRLAKMVPANAKNDKDKYLAYAYNLKTHADYLKQMVEQLIEHDAERAMTGQLSVDVLRDSAAAHYGGMVQMCVACHNRFRPHVVK